MCTRTVGGTHSSRIYSMLSSPKLQMRPLHARPRNNGRSVILASLDGHVRVIYVYFQSPVQWRSVLTGFAQAPHTPVSGCACGSLTLLLVSYIHSFHPFSCCSPTISTLNHAASRLVPVVPSVRGIRYLRLRMRTPAPDANASTNGYVYSMPPPVSVLVPPTLSPWLL